MDPGEAGGVDGDVFEVHPPKITKAVRIPVRSMNQRICITGKAHHG
jgi:hypothetical protein